MECTNYISLINSLDKFFLQERIQAMDANSANLYLAISSAFRDADNVLIKLATRFDEDYENMRGVIREDNKPLMIYKH